MLFKRKSSAADSLQGKRIGVLGLAPKNGTTHIAVAISNYLADTENKSVCLMEKNSHNDLEPFITSLGAPKNATDYEFHHVTYICSRGMSDEDKMLDASYDCMVFDLGSDMSSAVKTLCLCDLRIVVGAAAEWRRDEYAVLEKLSQRTGGLNNWLLLVNLGNEHCLKELRKYDIPMFCFPCEDDPVFPSEYLKQIMKAAFC